MSIRSYLKKQETLVVLNDKLKQFYQMHLISDERFIQKQFRKRTGREPELKEPLYYNDKLQWLKLHWHDSLAAQCADKYEVRTFVKERIGEEYLNELYGVFDSIDEIKIEQLPNSFVLKGTHGSGFNIVCKDKNEIDWDEAFKTMKRWLRTNYYWRNREWVYKDLKPRIICEKYIEQLEGPELRDYRFFCFNGVPKMISVDLSITNKKKTRRNLYDLQWSLIDGEISYPRELSIEIKKPNQLEKMIELSKQIAADFPHARVDFYNIGETIIFGEVTFFHQSGLGRFRPLELEKIMGEWLLLPKTN